MVFALERDNLNKFREDEGIQPYKMSIRGKRRLRTPKGINGGGT